MLPKTPAAAQVGARLERVRVRVEVAASGRDAVVVARYAVALPAAGAALGVRAIAFFGLRPEGVTATVDGIAARVDLADVGEAAVVGTIVPQAGAPPGGTIEVVLRYRVARAVRIEGRRLDIRVPLLFVDGAPASSAEDYFSAELDVPSEIALLESFPAVPLRHEAVDGGTRHSLVLPVVPSLLRWRATEGAPPLLSVVAGVDLALVIVILALGGLGAWALGRMT